MLLRVLSRVLRIMFAIGRCQSRVLPLRGAVQGAPDHVCHGAVQGAVQRCCPGCSGSHLLLGGVRVLLRVLSRVLRIMFAIGWCSPGCSPKCSLGCSGSCLPLGGVRVLFAWIVG